MYRSGPRQVNVFFVFSESDYRKKHTTLRREAMVSGYFSVYLQESNVSRLSRFSFSVPVVSSSATRWAPVLSLALPHRKHNKISSSRFAFQNISSPTCRQVYNVSRQPLIGKRGKDTGPEKMTEIKPTSLWIERKAYIRTIERPWTKQERIDRVL